MESSAAPVTLTRINLDPCLVCINIYSAHKVLCAVPSHVNHTRKHTHTHMHTQRLYIDLNRGMIIRGRSIKQ